MLQISDCRPEVQAFALLMERELRANDHKAGWKNDNAIALAQRVIEEARELKEVTSYLFTNTPQPTKDSLRAAIAEEAADVANMAMMVVDVCGALHYARRQSQLR